MFKTIITLAFLICLCNISIAIEPNTDTYNINLSSVNLTVLTYNTHLFKGSNAEVGNTAQNIANNAEEFFSEENWAPAEEFFSEKYWSSPKNWFSKKHWNLAGDAFSKEHWAPVGDIFSTKDDRMIVYDDDRRSQFIVDRIIESGADIVALQEVWACDQQKMFKERLQDIYPYTYNNTEQCSNLDTDEILSDTNEILKTATGSAKDVLEGTPPRVLQATSGLMLLSKYPLKMVKFNEFPPSRKNQDDKWARRGVVVATIYLSSDGPAFQVGVTDVTTDMGDKTLNDMPDLRDLAAWTTVGPSPTIMMGDFNVPIGDDPMGTQYNKMAKIFEDVGARDAYRDANNVTVNAPTVDNEANLLGKYFNLTGKSERKCLDYVFYKPSGSGLTIEPIAAKVITNWKYPDSSGTLMDLSDHYPLMVTFKVTRE